MTALNTANNIAKDIGVEYHQVTHVIKKLGIKPATRAGIIRVFSGRDTYRIKREFAQRTPSPRIPEGQGVSSSAAPTPSVI